MSSAVGAVAEGARARPGGGAAHRAVALLGELLLTLGVVVLLFCAYQLWWTNVTAGQASAARLDDLRTTWAAPGGPDYGVPAPAAGPTSEPAVEVSDPAEGEPFAVVRIPRLGDDWEEPVVEGIAAEQLSSGVGHYPGTALPGEVGNLALAGHRATNGEPFKDLDAMREGDEIVVETRARTYTYVVDRPWVLVDPSAVEMIAPVPGRPSVKATKRKLTLTTCNPRWASTERLIVEAVLRDVEPRG